MCLVNYLLVLFLLSCAHRKESFRREARLLHNNGRVYSVTECNQFFVCAHSNVCRTYKDRHCKKELALLDKIGKSAKAQPETC